MFVMKDAIFRCVTRAAGVEALSRNCASSISDSLRGDQREREGLRIATAITTAQSVCHANRRGHRQIPTDITQIGSKRRYASTGLAIFAPPMYRCLVTMRTALSHPRQILATITGGRCIERIATQAGLQRARLVDVRS